MLRALVITWRVLSLAALLFIAREIQIGVQELRNIRGAVPDVDSAEILKKLGKIESDLNDIWVLDNEMLGIAEDHKK